ncbi:MAG: ribonuclease R [Acholeplasmatales bacterium]|nr:ribonuclease R [Acholeplasmatales bacterium]
MDYKKEIYDAILHGVVKFNNLKKAFGIKRDVLDSYLNDLIKDESIIYDRTYDSYFALREATINVNPKGFGFARVDGEEKDYYIYPENLLGAFDGDRALVYPYEQGIRLINAKVYKIIKREHTFVIGKLFKKTNKKTGINRYYIESRMLSFPVSVNVAYADLGPGKDGNIVYADVFYHKNEITGRITRVLGYPDDPGIEIETIALEYGFKVEFSAETEKELEQIPDEVKESELKNRKDFTDLNVITIDGDDSKDFDDAVYLEKINDNYKLYVFIADVSYYVKEGSPLDKDAYKRGTSVYLADRVIPMIPRKLSNGICSLNENVNRLVLACIMEIDYKGNLINYDICEGVIKSHHRMTYNNVNKILNNDPLMVEKYNDIKDMLSLMQELSHIIRARRYKKGGIEFEVNEYKYTLNEDGSPKTIELRTRDEAEKLIEDFMLEANETIAYHMNISNLPCEYRIHEKPDQEKLQDVFDIIRNMGVNLPKTKNDIHPKQVQDALEKISDTAYKPVLNNMLLRSMMKAKYNEKCLGHYGLAMNYYCHFTSPIRRYPDLMVHRIIKKLLINPKNFDADLTHFEQILPEVCLNNSASERKSIECERAVDDMLSAWFIELQPKDSVFEGMITSITNFGMFVTLENGIEGLIQFANMNGYFDKSSDGLEAISYNKTYKLGQKVKVRILDASKETRKIDFSLEEDYHNDEV